MRFNDYHKNVSAALKLNDDEARKWRTFMLRCFTRRLTVNACLTLTRMEVEKARVDATPVNS